MDFIKVFKQELFSLWINKEKDIYNLNNTFDLFSILRNENDEVNLHSKFIYFLLNPLANHFQKSLFLKLFLNIIGETFDNSGFYMVKKEHKNIDLLITKDQTAIIIENKIVILYNIKLDNNTLYNCSINFNNSIGLSEA